jgi:hypothetical protein
MRPSSGYERQYSGYEETPEIMHTIYICLYFEASVRNRMVGIRKLPNKQFATRDKAVKLTSLETNAIYKTAGSTVTPRSGNPCGAGGYMYVSYIYIYIY